MINLICRVCEVTHQRKSFKHKRSITNTNISSMELFFSKKFKIGDLICELEYLKWTKRTKGKKGQIESLPEVLLDTKESYDVRVYVSNGSLDQKVKI
jgi:hypothetical protein